MDVAAMRCNLKSLRGKGKTRGRARLLLAAGALALLASSCSSGTYAVDIFPEQHYQQSAKRQEPPRIDPPPGAVPITGREAPLDPAAASQARNPLQANQANLTRGAEVFRVNCIPCHGEKGKGDGTVGAILVRDGYAKPPDLTLPVTQNKSDGELFFLISNGVVVMPRFSLLLSEQDRWAVEQYVRYLAPR